MGKLLERFLRYVKVDTQSLEDTGKSPSTPGQTVLAEMLADELRALGAERVRVTPYSVVFADIPPSPGCENAPKLGLIAHLDTSSAASGHDVKPRVVSYSGGVLELGAGRSIAPEEHTGKTLIVTDGTTLLGADDKAGIAEIVCCAEALLKGEVVHGPVRIAFTPDEEIGEGTRHFDLAGFGADYAYTADGGAAGKIETENFNAAAAVVRFRGVSVHPGDALGIMVNAQVLAMKFHGALPEKETPACTSGREGFFHLTGMTGTVGAAELKYILRDFDAGNLEKRKETLLAVADRMNAEYGAGTVEVALRDQYRNMREVLDRYPFLTDIAVRAAEKAGLKPSFELIRGGTDGAMLSLAGLPCPNLGTGGYNYHGECEYAVLEEMTSSVRMLTAIAEEFAHLPAK